MVLKTIPHRGLQELWRHSLHHRPWHGRQNTFRGLTVRKCGLNEHGGVNAFSLRNHEIEPMNRGAKTTKTWGLAPQNVAETYTHLIYPANIGIWSTNMGIEQTTRKNCEFRGNNHLISMNMDSTWLYKADDFTNPNGDLWGICVGSGLLLSKSDMTKH